MTFVSQNFSGNQVSPDIEFPNKAQRKKIISDLDSEIRDLSKKNEKVWLKREIKFYVKNLSEDIDPKSLLALFEISLKNGFINKADFKNYLKSEILK